jgi:hypothetical protein
MKYTFLAVGLVVAVAIFVACRKQPAASEHTSSDDRFLVMMQVPVFAELINRATPFSADHVTTLEAAMSAMSRQKYSAVLAMSPSDQPDAAASLITAF